MPNAMPDRSLPVPESPKHAMAKGLRPEDVAAGERGGFSFVLRNERIFSKQQGGWRI